MADIDEETVIEIASGPYPFAQTADQQLRCFIAKYYANSEIDGAIMVQNLDLIYHWVKDGTLPAKKAKPALVK